MTSDDLQNISEKEVGLKEIYVFVRTHFLRLTGLAIVGGLIGVGLCFLVPKQWEASLLLQVGQIQFNGAAQPTLIEPVAQVVERVKNRAFIDDVTRALEWDPENDSAPVRLLRKTLAAKSVPATQLVELSARGYSQKDALSMIQSAQQLLVAAHTQVVDAALKSILAQLNEVNRELVSRQSVVDKLQQRMAMERPSSGATARPSDALLFGSLALSSVKTEDLVRLKFDLEQQASPIRTFTSKPLQRIVVSRFPVFPKLPLFLGSGFFLGFALGFCWAVILELTRLSRKEPQVS